MIYNLTASFPSITLQNSVQRLRYWFPPSISPKPPTLPVAKSGMAVSVLAPSTRKCLIDNRHALEIDVNTFHAVDADAKEYFSGARVKRGEDIRVTGELVPTAGWVEAPEASARVSRLGSLQRITLTFSRTWLVAPPPAAGGVGGRPSALLH